MKWDVQASLSQKGKQHIFVANKLFSITGSFPAVEEFSHETGGEFSDEVTNRCEFFCCVIKCVSL